jgi:uncharacterized membrane protein
MMRLQLAQTAVRGRGKMGVLRYRTRSGEIKFWTLKEILQGKSINRVTHPVFVVFPIAFFSGALGADVLSRLGLSGAALAGTYAVAAGLIGALFAILTGLVDRSTMNVKAKIRRVATRHMYIQLTATAIFVANLAIRWSDRAIKHGKVVWIVLDVLGLATVIVGGDVGASMVFKMGYRVGSSPPDAEPAPPAADTEAQLAP